MAINFRIVGNSEVIHLRGSLIYIT